MKIIPEFFEQGGDTTLHPFSYDFNRQTFLVADCEVPLSEFDPYTFNVADVGLDDKGIPISEVGNHPLYLPVLPGILVASSMLHEWARLNPRRVTETWLVIHDAYTKLHQGLKGNITKRPTRSHMGFAAGLREFGGIGLQTVGSCACMGPTVDGVYVSEQFEHDYGEYELHNAEEPEQRASLFAGMGHIAYLAASGVTH